MKLRDTEGSEERKNEWTESGASKGKWRRERER